MYKLISKTLVNRPRKCLSFLIDSSQSALVHNRLITDNALLAMEAFYSIQVEYLYLGESYMAIKLDMMKSYNRVELSFLQRVLRSMGFPERWVEVIMLCV